MTIKHDHHHECGCDVTQESVDLARRRLLARAAGAAAVGAVGMAASGTTAMAATKEAMTLYAKSA